MLIREWSRDLAFLRPSTMPMSTAAERARLSGLGVHVVWAAGNISDPRASVLGAAAAGSLTATAINRRLVSDDVAAEQPFPAENGS